MDNNIKESKLFELERTIEGYVVQLPCHEQGHIQLGQGAQSPTPSDLEYIQEQDIHHTSRQHIQT